jgi:hypothetical protein
VNTDLLIIWAWEHDADFVDLLYAASVLRGLSVHTVGSKDLPILAASLASGLLQARAVIDRVWDWGDEYAAHCGIVREQVRQGHSVLLNDYDLVRRSWHKPTMHYEVIARGMSAPHMVVLPACDAQPELAPPDLTRLGRCFSVKGAHSGGSGVLRPCCSWEDVLRLRAEWPTDETILQAWVEPDTLGQRRAWFRVFYACGSTFLCWADDRTHDQTPVTREEESQWRLSILRGMVQQIAGLCGLNVFSTEIALDTRHIWQVIDYVNEPCDYRLKSTVSNGVPDDVVKDIAERMASWARRQARFDTTLSVG